MLSGNDVTNGNRNFNMKHVRFYVCPLCGNVLFSTGDAVICCCGLTLPPLEAEPADEDHRIETRQVEDEIYVSLSHGMSKTHYISFLAAVTDFGVQLVKFYPEQEPEARFKFGRILACYAYCNRHGLMMLAQPQRSPRTVNGRVRQNIRQPGDGGR